MSYLPAKRQRSNTSRESSNAIPQTNPPALRQQHPNQLNGNLALFPTAATSAAYSNGPYAATQSSVAPSGHHQTVNYASYSAGPVTTQHNAYGGGGYQNSASTTGYGATPYSPQHQSNPYANQYTHAQPSPQLSPHAGHYAAPGLNAVQTGGYAQTHSHNPQNATRMTYSPVSTTHQTVASYNQPVPQRSNAAVATMQTQSQHSLPSYGDSYASHTPTHSGQYQNPSPSYPDPSVASHYSPAPMHTPQSHDVSRHMSEDIPENDEEDAQGEPADESQEIYTNPEPPRPPVSSIPTPSTDQSKPGEISCACKKGRGKKKACISCGCSKYGLSCNTACSCGNACGNPFKDLSAFFGPSEMFSRRCGANQCFATWLRNQPNIEELDTDLMVDMLLSDDVSWAQIREYTDAFRQWEDKWKKACNGKGKKSKDDRERLEFELLRGGLGSNTPEDFMGFNGFRYSFCQSKWVPAEIWDHCPECRMCRSSIEWHCHKHDRCTENRVCPGCASTTLPYHHQQQQQQQRQVMYPG